MNGKLFPPIKCSCPRYRQRAAQGCACLYCLLSEVRFGLFNLTLCYSLRKGLRKTQTALPRLFPHDLADVASPSTYSFTHQHPPVVGGAERSTQTHTDVHMHTHSSSVRKALPSLNAHHLNLIRTTGTAIEHC